MQRILPAFCRTTVSREGSGECAVQELPGDFLSIAEKGPPIIVPRLIRSVSYWRSFRMTGDGGDESAVTFARLSDRTL